MRKLLGVTIALLLLSELLLSQQLPLFTQYREQAVTINPAVIQTSYLLNSHQLNVGAGYRNQWINLENPASTAIIRGDYLYVTGGATNLVFGGHLMRDQTGPISNTGIFGKIAGLFSSDPEFVGISVGLSAGFVQYRVNPDKIRLHDAGDLIPQNNVSKYYPDVSVGVFGYKRLDGGGYFDDDLVYGGLSIPQTIGSTLKLDSDNGTLYTKRVQHFYGNLGMIKKVGEEGFLEPSAWLRYAINTPFSADFNLKYQMSQSFWIGIGASTAGNTHFETGVILGEKMGLDANVRFGYGFDYSFNTFGPFVGGTHEISITFSR
ncbi:MAG: PorP/SprF family type IX secretion system membrane protein [Saprospiraceae bacterium]|nr:PorP/SprF family type IX secretion system membrane protein [Saprospiraceae bacterium]MBP7699734.1 PorP/SprF family type IX secretion system membrane protein [Saprospiraceae bacterium]